MPETHSPARRVTAEDLRRDLDRIMDEAVAHHEPVTVTRGRGQGDLVLIAAAAWEGWMETIHLLSTSANAKRLRGSIREFGCGHGGRD